MGGHRNYWLRRDEDLPFYVIPNTCSVCVTIYGAIGTCLYDNGAAMVADATHTRNQLPFIESLKTLLRPGTKLPVNLLFDGHKSHLTVKAREAMDGYFLPLKMPPNSPWLNAVERLWAVLKTRTGGEIAQLVENKPKKLLERDQLIACIHNAYETITPKMRANLTRSHYRSLLAQLNYQEKRHAEMDPISELVE